MDRLAISYRLIARSDSDFALLSVYMLQEQKYICLKTVELMISTLI